jgi:hypothetical protein
MIRPEAAWRSNLREAHGVRDKRPSAGRGMTDQSRRDAWASRMASLILAVFILYIVVTCLHLFTNKL